MGTGPPDPVDQARAARNERWATLRARGVPWRKIAKLDGVSLSTVQRGVQAHVEAVERTVEAGREVVRGSPAAAALADAERPADLSAEALYLHVIAAIVDSLDQLEELSLTAGHASWRIGAAKGRLQGARELAHALALVGLLPDPARVLLARAARGRTRDELRRLMAGAA